MSFSFSINAKPQSNRLKKPSPAETDSSTINHVREFRPDEASKPNDSSTIKYVKQFHSDEAPTPPDSKIKPIAPIPNAWRPNKRLKNLPNLPQLSQPNGEDVAVQFELDPGSNPEPCDSSMGFGLNIRQQSAAGSDVPSADRFETISDMELRVLREDLVKLPDGPRLDEFEDVPVEGFGAALLSGYGWKEGRGIGRNAKEDVIIAEVTRKRGRGGLGFTDELPQPDNRINSNGSASESLVNANGKSEKLKGRNENDRKGFVEGKEVRIVSGRDLGMKGKILEVRSGGLLLVRMSKSNQNVKVQARYVVEVGSAEEEKCMRKLKGLRIKENDPHKDRRNERSHTSKSGQGEKARSERVNWLRDHIRVRIISEELKGGRLFLKKGVVVDVVGPGVCDISIDDSRELVQGVDQELLETALPKRGGPVILLYGRHKGVYGILLERDPEKEIGVVRDADTQELLNVKLEQVAEYTGDPSEFDY